MKRMFSTTVQDNHNHEAYLDSTGTGETSIKNNHKHKVVGNNVYIKHNHKHNIIK